METRQTNLNADLKPIFAPMRRITAANAKPSASFNDLTTAFRLYREVQSIRTEWTLHEIFNVPKCRKDCECNVCITYLTHLQDARTHSSRRPVPVRRKKTESDDPLNSNKSNPSKKYDDGIENDNTKDDSEDSGSEDSDSEDNDLDLELGDYPMDCLFRLQDIQGKIRVFGWDDRNTKESQEAGGYAAAMLLQMETEKKLENLQISHGRLLNERDQLHTEFELVTAQRNQYQSQLEEVNAQLTAALHEITRLRLSTNEPELPRKRIRNTTESNVSRIVIHFQPFI